MNIKVIKKLENSTSQLITETISKGHLNHLYFKGTFNDTHKVKVTYLEGTKEILLMDSLPVFTGERIKAPLPVKSIQTGGANTDSAPTVVNIPNSSFRFDLGSVYLGNGRKLKIEFTADTGTNPYDLSIYSTSNSLLAPHFITYETKFLKQGVLTDFSKSLSLSLFSKSFTPYNQSILKVETSNQNYTVDVISLIEIQHRQNTLDFLKVLNGIPTEVSVKSSTLPNDNLLVISKSLEFPYGHINTEITRNLEMSYFSTLALEKNDPNFIVALQRSGMGYSKEFYADSAYKFQR